MNCQQLLNTMGLILGMSGVLIIFLFGPPQPSFEEGVSLGLEDANLLGNGQTVASHNKSIKRLKVRYSRLSKSGLGLVFIGFAFQLWATWV